MTFDTTDRHPSTAHVAQFFNSAHLPPNLQYVSDQCGDLAANMIDLLPDGPELTVGLRKLLEAKDAFVRTAVLAAVEVAEAPDEGAPEPTEDPESVCDGTSCALCANLSPETAEATPTIVLNVDLADVDLERLLTAHIWQTAWGRVQ